MEVFLKILGYLSLVLLVVSVYFMVRSVGRQRRLSLRTLIVPLVSVILFLIIYSLILDISPPAIASAFLALAGLGVGIFWGRTTALSAKGTEVYGRRSAWYVVVWGISIAITQVLALLSTPSTVSWGLSTIYFSTGLAYGMNGYLLFRRWKVLSGRREGPQHTCPACGAKIKTGGKFCPGCGQTMAPVPAPIPATPRRSKCPACGHVSPPGTRFCSKCGQSLA